MKNGFVNRKFLSVMRPSVLAIYGALFWLVLFFSSSIKIKQSISLAPVLYVVLCYVFFLAGCLSLKKLRIRDYEMSFGDSGRLLKFLRVIIAIALLGFIFRFADKVLLRGISFSGSSFYNRELLVSSGPSIISILSAIINPFSFLPLFVYYILDIKNRPLLVISTVLFFASSFEYVLLGSRSGIFVVLLFFMLYLFYFKKTRITWARLISLVFIFAMVGVFMTNMFIDRTAETFGSKEIAVKHILTNAGYNYTLEPKTSVISSITESKNETYQAFKLGRINFSQYYLHGFFEFGYLYENYNKEHHCGLYTFNIFAKLIETVFGTDLNLEKIQKSPPRVGVYTTFFGPLFLDFGWFSLIFMYFFGLVLKIMFNKVANGKFYFLPLLFYASIIVFFMPVINFITAAQGIYIITAFSLFVGVYLILNKKIVFKDSDGSTVYIRFLK